MEQAARQQTESTAPGNADHGPKYFVDLEGVEYEWHQWTITVPQIRELAGWPNDQQVVLVNLETNEETVLDNGAVVELKPGHGFGRKFKFKRGVW